MAYHERALVLMAYKTEPTLVSTLLALMSGVVFSVVIWFALSRVFNMDSSLAAALGVIVGGIEYFVLRYILSQNYYPDREAE